MLVDCTWNDWELGECSVTCAGGTRVDTRTVATEAMHGGFCDPEGDMRVQECNPEACPGKCFYRFHILVLILFFILFECKLFRQRMMKFR